MYIHTFTTWWPFVSMVTRATVSTVTIRTCSMPIARIMFAIWLKIKFALQIICYSMGVICDRESSRPTWLKHYGIYTSQLITNTAGVVTFCPYFFVHKISLNQTYHSICQFSVSHVVSRALLRFTTSGYSVGINLQLTCNIFIST